MNVTVLGSGRWGTFLAVYHSRKNNVALWGLEGSPDYEQLLKERKNSYLELPDNLVLEPDLSKALDRADYIVISISAQHLRSFCERINQYNVHGKTFILCMKGIESETGERLSTIVKETIRQYINICVWVGPGHVQDFMAGIPNCMVVDSEDKAVINDVVSKFSTDLIRLYLGDDIIGTEIGAAAKNVIGIAAGMLDGEGLSSLKGALMARGAREVSRLINAMGGNELSAYGLSHLGDYEATLFSPHSQNRMFGEKFITQQPYAKLAEGAATVKALMKLSAEYNVEMPISKLVYDVLYNGAEAREALSQLFSRDVKQEFENTY
ncbi:MAG: NAD(P)H-dependent glycerol-3-phosphate dehydrogenase [Oscillospiraceae bacterium]|nr:NAD(P)H-dependent glycerol-3-phosphate dehydrogenase [Oscillospiraceae bacterium]